MIGGGHRRFPARCRDAHARLAALRRNAAAFKLPIIGQPLCIMLVWIPCVLVGLWATTPAAALPGDVRDNEILGLMVARHAGAVGQPAGGRGGGGAAGAGIRRGGRGGDVEP